MFLCFYVSLLIFLILLLLLLLLLLLFSLFRSLFLTNLQNYRSLGALSVYVSVSSVRLSLSHSHTNTHTHTHNMKSFVLDFASLHDIDMHTLSPHLLRWAKTSKRSSKSVWVTNERPSPSFRPPHPKTKPCVFTRLRLFQTIRGMAHMYIHICFLSPPFVESKPSLS